MKASLGVIALGLSLCSIQAASQIPDRFTNLRVLPKKITPDSLLTVMGSFTRALGVRCTHCHVARDSAGQSRMVYSADDKETKRVARGMLKMVAEINGRHLPGVGRRVTARSRVTCNTCHGGLTRPRSLEAELLDAYDARGLDSAIVRYRTLRKEHYGSRAYDFTDVTLANVAGQLASTPQGTRDGIRLLQLNIEFDSTSWFSYQEMGRLQAEAGDTTAAIGSLQRGLQINPRRAFMRQMLDSLQARVRPRP